ncbi:hypothetical protein Acor_40820 [Acrocarpospora corrugata]|uniref:HTH gntR-type domain-containing protein n=1 Tax=Acrocarpospora corrugata TaxID=35763 RepID=A0A5M3VYR7_9ACTN|nr:winged helix-turn-helix domain-containing protein [Acrocarpospora corrugata]GES02017.1 hypothetical protein Acor_40820 [Acrocarpospora corrugata]
MTGQVKGQISAGLQRKDEPSWVVLSILSREIMEDLARRIEDGEFAEDTRVPGVQELRNTYEVPGSVVRSALRELADRRYIRHVPGQGYIVGVPGASPVSPRDDDPGAVKTYVIRPWSDRLPIPGADVLLTRRKATGKSTTRERTAETGPLRVLAGPAAVEREIGICIFTQVADIMAERIDTGVFSSGERFASLAELRREFTVSDATARRVLRDLTDRGLIHTIPGRGTFTGPPDAGHPRPQYQQIAADLAGQIYSGQIPIHHVIPTRTKLRVRYGVSDHTVGEAISLLRSLGWVIRALYRRPVAAPPFCWPVSPGDPVAS